MTSWSSARRRSSLNSDAGLLGHLQHRRREARVVLVVDVLHQLHLLARLDPRLGEDGGEGRAHRQELAERQIRVVDDEQLVEQPQRRALALHQRRHVHQHLDERRVERIDVAQVVDVAAGEQRRQHLLVPLRQRADRRLHGGRVLRAQHAPA